MLNLLNHTDVIDIFLDFENVRPTDAEKNTYNGIMAILMKCPVILKKLQNFPGNEELIRKSIIASGGELEDAAMSALFDSAWILNEIFQFSIELAGPFQLLLLDLCSRDPKEKITTHQALAQQLAEMLTFALQFDGLKMQRSSQIQNSFAYYRRLLSKRRINKVDSSVAVRDELANRISLFIASPTPMMNAFIDETTKFMWSNHDFLRPKLTLTFATIANVCQDMVSKRRFTKEATNLFCLRAMTGALVLFDHVDLIGAFHKKTPINLKGCVELLKQHSQQNKQDSEALLNAIRFTTLHLNDPDTPLAIRQMFI
jgi:hypothetical protein